MEPGKQAQAGNFLWTLGGLLRVESVATLNISGGLDVTCVSLNGLPTAAFFLSARPLWSFRTT